MTAIPPLHVVTDDEVLADPSFRDRAAALLEGHGGSLALHLRGPRVGGRALHDLAAPLAEAARSAGALLVVNDRLDVALAVRADAVHLGARSIPVPAARRLRGEWTIGVSVRGPEEAAEAVAGGAAYLFVGTIWGSASHPGREGAGPERVREVTDRVSVPTLAIGGVTPDRVRVAVEAGAHGVAVIRGVWSAADPVRAAAAYLEALGSGV